jgi:hypothetical protein
MWSFRAAAAEAEGIAFGTSESREIAMAANRNTCHVWADDSELQQKMRSGAPMEQPVWMRRRVEELGLDPASVTMRG